MPILGKLGMRYSTTKAATEILFRRRLWVDDTPVLGVECAMPSLLLRGAGETTNQAEGEPAAPGQDC